MGVSVRKKGSSWFVFIRHKADRAAQKYKSEDEANAVAAVLRESQKSGGLDAVIASMKQHRAAKQQRKVKEKPELPTVPTLEDFYNATVLPLWEASLSPATYQSYEGSFRVHILLILGTLALPDVSPDRIKSFVASLRKKSVAPRRKKVKSPAEDGTEQKKDEEKLRLLSKESIRNIVAALRSALSEAVESNIIAANPAVKLGKFYKEAKDFHEEIDPFTSAEVSLLLQATREHHGFENYVLLLTLFHCGLRAGEAAGLHWSDLDVRNKALLIRRQFTRGKSAKTKTRKKRSVDISTVILSELQALKKQRQTAYLAKGKNEIHESIFLGPGQIIWEEGKPVGREEGQPLDMNNWRNRIYWKACDTAKIRRRRLHDTRHSFASLLLSNGRA
jgi:integrase